ncbi:DDE_3 domain-containing protein [Trichonephila clavipes]|nr:DDE_3 domain-containing protein [Trichonephila clavipes]
MSFWNNMYVCFGASWVQNFCSRKTTPVLTVQTLFPQFENITRMDWPAYSPNLNPIEHVWDMFGQRIAACQPPPICLAELRRALLDVWCNIPQDEFDNLILSMLSHGKACIAPSGRQIPY